MAEKHLSQCQQASQLQIQSKSHDDSPWEEFVSIFTKQYLGIVVGVVMSLFFRFCDQLYASWFAKKHHIKQKEIMQAAFPTVICLAKYLLRKRSKNSKLAVLLSLLKLSSKNAKTPTHLQSTSNDNQSEPRTPKPLSSVSSTDTDLDSVFTQTKVRQNSKTKSRSVSVRYKKKSTVVLNLNSST